MTLQPLIDCIDPREILDDLDAAEAAERQAIAEAIEAAAAEVQADSAPTPTNGAPR